MQLCYSTHFAAMLQNKLHSFCCPFYQGNSLVLCCASPSGHIIATSKGAVIFTGCLKRGNYGPFSSPNAFIAILIILPG